MEYQKDAFLGHLIKGDLCGAMEYIRQFPEQDAVYQKYVSRFEQEDYEVFEADDTLNKLLLIYQKYYRDIFYLRMEPERAVETMKRRFMKYFHSKEEELDFGDLENDQIKKAFERKSFQFLGGRTGGFWGPYIWKTTETRRYDVELPDGVRGYEVKLLDGFISQSWLHYISFGDTGTGGWTDGEGIINCVRACYDMESEDFRVSLLKHEAQHAADLAVWPDMSSEDLEYRAKLVELIYSSQRNLFSKYKRQADGSNRKNGHAAAADRIVSGFGAKLGGEAPDDIPIAKVQNISWELFMASNEEMKRNYHKKA